ncbi:MAG: DUF2029 domain-containing protein [Acidobacteria bacterium]|nr:DUF2029 domain-containing protein [Acidobacteriota bacterium]
MTPAPPQLDDRGAARLVGWVAVSVLGLFLGGFAFSVNFPVAAHGFQSDEATYYSLAHSLASDGDFVFERKDLTRVWKEFPTGPEGIFLKRGRDLEVRWGGRFPFVHLARRQDRGADRLYYGKSYIYPLVAAPFVRLFGTNGFLILHAILMVLSFACTYAFLVARGRPPVALLYAGVFFVGSVVPVYMVWLTPELFNLSLAIFGLLLWTYKEVAAGPGGGVLRSASSDYWAAGMFAIATFSKPTNIVLILPVIGLHLWRRQWRGAVIAAVVYGSLVVALLAGNLAISGEVNFQGGDRKTFYAATGFPFQSAEATFDTVGQERTTDSIPFDVLLTRDALVRVFPHNLAYFVFGRHTGLVPYFFPGVLSFLLFLGAGSRRERWQWLLASTVVVASVGLLLYMPHTYSGGGGPIGNRYFLGFYPILLFLTPPLRSVVAPVAALAVGGLFTAQLVANPFEVSFRPAEHPKSGPYRVLPVELTLLNDLPVNVTPRRVRQPLAGDPPVLAYFLDNNAYDREGDRFWVRGESRAELILRAPTVPRPDGTYTSLHLAGVNVELQTGEVATQVTMRSAAEYQEVALAGRATGVVRLRMGAGVPYRPYPGQPTTYAYLLSIGCDAGFVPLFSSASRDSRYLGVLVRIVPVYVE